MGKITKLQKISDERRDFLETKYLNYTEENEYSGDHADAQHDENDKEDLKGKGAVSGLNRQFIMPSEDGSKISYTPTVNTESGGGAYDIDGNPKVDAGQNGRNWAMNTNLYNRNKEYGSDLIDTSDFKYYFKTNTYPKDIE